MTLQENVALNTAALRVQRNYIAKKAKQIEEQYKRAHEEHNRRLMGHRGVEPDLHDSARRGSTSGRRAR